MPLVSINLFYDMLLIAKLIIFYFYFFILLSLISVIFLLRSVGITICKSQFFEKLIHLGLVNVLPSCEYKPRKASAPLH